MADIANVTGTLDDKELNFQHSIGTVYKASASIDGSEKDHVAVLTATDSAGNSTTETMVISISGSWTTPKTDWYGYTDDDGIYHGDFQPDKEQPRISQRDSRGNVPGVFHK